MERGGEISGGVGRGRGISRGVGSGGERGKGIRELICKHHQYKVGEEEREGQEVQPPNVPKVYTTLHNKRKDEVVMEIMYMIL